MPRPAIACLQCKRVTDLVFCAKSQTVHRAGPNRFLTPFSTRTAQLNFQVLAAFPVVLFANWALRSVWASFQKRRGVYSRSVTSAFHADMR